MPTSDRGRGAAGVIHDIGYQRYTGVRLGRDYAVRSLYVHGVRTVFGLGRGPKAKIFPWFSASVLMLFAVIDVAVRAKTGTLPISYLNISRDGVLLVLLFLATAAPELVSRDLRNKTLPLYFSRPLERTDYILAKYAALVTGVFLVLAAPMLVVFLGGAFSLNGAHAVWREFTDFLGGLVWAAVVAVVESAVALLIASLLRRAAVATAVIAGYFLLTTGVGQAIGAIIGSDTGKNIGNMLSPPDLLEGLKKWAYRIPFTDVAGFGPAYLTVTVLMTAVAVALLLVRYRRVSV
ncbi:MAG TPA: ABC transporter permease subunit [Micromonosporaceae bacterium]|jgi:ABC-2 type transport system permease protein|nr:ABC transporter permease subunit [Micromonosporaceae bacterium]